MATIPSTESVGALIERLQSPDETISTAAWQNAGPYGALAVKPLVALMGSSDAEMSRRARRALERVVHHAGHPALRRQRREVERMLVEVLPAAPMPVRRKVVWLLSAIGEEACVSAIAGQLGDPEVREDARCALTRLSNEKAVGALWSAFESAPEDFKFALADSLRRHGQKVKGYESRKLIPTAHTAVAPVKPKTS